MDSVNLDQLRTAFLAGGVRTVGVAASGGLFFVTAQWRASGTWVALATTRTKRPRAFREPGKAILLLHGIGVKKIIVDVSGWAPEQPDEEARRRPDVAARWRKLREEV